MSVLIEDHGVIPVHLLREYTQEGIRAAPMSLHSRWYPQRCEAPLRSRSRKARVSGRMGSRFVGRSGASMWASRLAGAGAAPGGLFRQGRYRPLLYRGGALREYVPYADPTPSTTLRTCFDAASGHRCAGPISLELGCDCLGEIYS